MKNLKYQLQRSNWRNAMMICRGISEERLDDDYDAIQYEAAFDDSDTNDSEFGEEEL